MIAAPNVLLPGIIVSGQSVEPTFEACVRRCIQFPDCHSERMQLEWGWNVS